MMTIARPPRPAEDSATDDDAAALSRRQALGRIGAWAAACAVPVSLSGCGGGGDPIAPVSQGPGPAPAPAPPAGPSLRRLKAALSEPAPPGTPVAPISVSQGAPNTIDSSFGVRAAFIPPLDDPQQANLGTASQVWGYRRALWLAQAGAVIMGRTVYPMLREHRSATNGSNGVCGLHFMFDGRAFELLVAGVGSHIALVVDGRYAATRTIETTLDAGLPGTPLSVPNTLLRFDFGSATARKVSLYANSSQGPCALVVDSADHVAPWDRSAEASFAVMTDSYGQAPSRHWGPTGPFWEAAAALGIPHLDSDAIGSTGYAPNNANAETRNPSNAFLARLGSIVDASPDLFLTAGGLNDNNSVAALPLYASAADAQAGFEAAVARHYVALRTELPNAVLAATGPWAPRQVTPPETVARSKAETIKAALRAVGGPWVFLDNLEGSWSNSVGAGNTPSGPWQTGTGRAGAPAGDGNGDLYLSSDGVHPNETGSVYLATRIASDLRAAIGAL